MNHWLALRAVLVNLLTFAILNAPSVLYCLKLQAAKLRYSRKDIVFVRVDLIGFIGLIAFARYLVPLFSGKECPGTI